MTTQQPELREQPLAPPTPDTGGDSFDMPIDEGDTAIIGVRVSGQEVLPAGAIVPASATIQASDWQAMKEIAAIAVKSGIYPKLGSAAEGLARILAGREVGLGPSASLANLYVVNGRVAMGAGLIGALIKHSGRYNYKIKVLTKTAAEIEFYEYGVLAGVSTFDMVDAKDAGVLDRKDSPWNHYPRNMLFARALSNGARWYCPDVFHGAIYTPEELEQRLPTINASGPSLASGSGDESESNDDSFKPDAFVRTAYAPTSGDDEPCPLHWQDAQAIAGCKGPVKFFKRGKMRSHAHPLSLDRSGGWCNRLDVCDGYKRDVAAALRAKGVPVEEGGKIITAAFPDLAGVPSKEWRTGDWHAIVEYLSAHKAAGA